jgi:hypothetical protein
MFNGIIPKTIIICILIGVGYVVGTFSVPACAQKKLQYKVISLYSQGQDLSGEAAFESLLNRMAGDGWEFVGYSTSGGGVGGAIFKR